MQSKSLTSSVLEEIGLIAIVRTNFSAPIVEAGHALARGGVQAMEITLNTPGALEAIRRLRDEAGDGLHIGAGTILDGDDARRALDAGAEFIVTPTLQLDSIAVCRERGAPIACGCMTPTEALAAHRAGADFIKVFPADTLGPKYMKAMLAPLPFLKLIPTSGISLENLAAFIEAGCAGVALGSGLVGREILQQQDWDRLADLAAEFVQKLSAARSASARRKAE